MSGYFVPKLARFQQRAPGQVVKPTLVDYYDKELTGYINEAYLPNNPTYPTFPKYIQPQAGSPQQQQRFSAEVLGGLSGKNKLVLAGLAVVAGIIVVTMLQKSGKFKFFGAETFDSGDFEEMDQPYQKGGKGVEGAVEGVVEGVSGALDNQKKT